MAKKKISFVITKGSWGGAQRYVFDLATHLPSSRFNVEAAVGGEGLLKERLLLAKIQTTSLPHLQRDIGLLSDLKAFFHLLAYFNKEQPDIVHLNSSKGGALGALAARVAGVRQIIFTAHGWPFLEERPAWQLVLIKMVSMLTAALSTATIVITKKDHALARHWPFIHKKIHYIPNGIAAATHHDRETARNFLAAFIKKPPEFLADKFILGTIAELTGNKAIETVLPILPHQKKLLYIVLGEGEKRKPLEKLRTQLGLEKEVFFAGFVKNAEEFLPAFDLFLLPSRKEGLSYTLLEAGRANVPVVASDVGGNPDIITDEETGLLFDRKHPKEMGDKIASLTRNSKKREALSVALLHKVEREFSLSRMVEKTISLYENA